MVISVSLSLERFPRAILTVLKHYTRFSLVIVKDQVKTYLTNASLEKTKKFYFREKMLFWFKDDLNKDDLDVI